MVVQVAVPSREDNEMYQVVRYMLRRVTRGRARTRAHSRARIHARAFTHAARVHTQTTAGAHGGRPPRGPDQRAALDDRLRACECGSERLPPASAGWLQYTEYPEVPCFAWTERAAKQ